MTTTRLSVPTTWARRPSQAFAIHLPVTVVASLLVAASFFLPWLHGGGIFSYREFSGFELARIAHDLGSGETPLSLPGIATLLYLMPAIALNVTVLALLGSALRLPSATQALFPLASGSYGVFVGGLVLLLSLVPGLRWLHLIDGPAPGLYLALGANLVLVVSGFRRLRRPVT